MKLYIQIENGQPINHPAFEENLTQALGSVPAGWEEFVRVERPTLGVYQLLDSETSSYGKIDGVWTDVWSIRDMTAEEKTARQQAVISTYRNHPQAENWSAWTLDEATCQMVAPIPRPETDAVKMEAGILTVWCGAENNWKDTPAYPVDNNQYDFNFSTWDWVAI